MLLLTPAGPEPAGGLLSLSAPILVVGGVVLVLLAHKPIATWLASLHRSVHEHCYGPTELHVPEVADTGEDSEPAEEEPDDFDYDIYKT